MPKRAAKKLNDLAFSKRISINDLILFGIFSIVSSNQKCTFERLVKECFVLFPGAVAFHHYPQWPDSRKLDRPLRTLRDGKLISGDPKTFFSLTKKGKEIAEGLAKTLRQGKLL